jgi:hypothetical protein
VSSHGNHHIYCSSHKYVDDGLVILKIEKNWYIEPAFFFDIFSLLKIAN